MVHLMTLFTVALVIAILHHSAFVYYWYWLYWWFDIVVHFLGGFFIGLSSMWLFKYVFQGTFVTQSREWVLTICAVALVAGFWEMFELYGGIANAIEPGFGIDTTLDLCVGLLGGGIAWLLTKTRT